VDEIKWEVNKNYILKNDMMVLDLLAGFNWDRPVYFAITTGDDAYVGLQEYFQLEGLAYRLVPYKAQSTDGQTGEVHSDIMYDNLMNKFHWGGMDKYHIYLNENNRRMCMNIRNNFARLAEKLISENKKEKALKVLDKCVEVLPEHNVPYDFFMLPIAEAYYKCGAIDKANEIIRKLSGTYERELNYYFSLEDEYRSVKNNAQRAMSILYRLVNVTQQYKQEELHKEVQAKFDQLQQLYAAKEGMVSG
jgi:tetratricopeptide (TPR) repeat protein